MTIATAVSAESISKILPAALQAAPVKDLGRALRPVVETAILESVSRNVQFMAEAISPLLLPGIKRAITEYFKQIMQTLDKALEHSLSPQGIRWRIEAIRTGRPFSEVVLLHSLRFRVEDVFLIHKASGILLAHASHQHVGHADEIAGMLTAIRDFVKDSFAPDAGAGLRTMEVGTVTVWIEDLPQGAVAAVIRGEPPFEYRSKLAAVGRAVSASYSIALSRFHGDVAPFQRSVEILEEALIESLNKERTEAPLPRRLRQGAVIAAAGLALTLLGMVFWQGWQRGARRQAELSAFFQSLNQRPGVVILSTDTQTSGVRIQALRDPFAKIDDLSLPASTEIVWHEFISADPQIVVERARQILNPPTAVQLKLEHGVLALAGQAPRAWILNAQLLARSIPGVQLLDTSKLGDSDQLAFDHAAQALEAMTLHLELGQLKADEPSAAWIQAFCTAAEDLDRHGLILGIPTYIVLATAPGPGSVSRLWLHLDAVAGMLSWRLQTQGVVTYRFIRTDVSGELPKDGLVRVRVVRHGVGYSRR